MAHIILCVLQIELVKIMQNDYWQQKNTETKAARAKEKAAKAAKKQEEVRHLRRSLRLITIDYLEILRLIISIDHYRKI